MKTLIRVQDSLGTGMFQSGIPYGQETSKSVYSIEKLEDLARRHREFPNIRDDRTIFNFVKELYGEQEIFDIYGTDEFRFRFAFKNLSQFEKWVKREEVKILLDNGYRVYKIEAEEVCESEFQSIFNIDTVINTEDITNLFLD